MQRNKLTDNFLVEQAFRRSRRNFTLATKGRNKRIYADARVIVEKSKCAL